MLNTKTIAELKQFCDDFGLEYTKNARKQDVITVIEESGLTFDDYEGSSLGFKDYVEPEKQEVIEAVREVSNETILLTPIITRSAYVHGIKFELEEQFISVEKNLAQLILSEESNGIREATPEEYNSLVGVS
jgi:hypothetical protein